MSALQDWLDDHSHSLRVDPVSMPNNSVSIVLFLDRGYTSISDAEKAAVLERVDLMAALEASGFEVKPL